jgi:hypothetical protein
MFIVSNGLAAQTTKLRDERFLACRGDSYGKAIAVNYEYAEPTAP